MAVATAEPLTVEPLQGAGDTGWLTAHKEANNMGEKKKRVGSNVPIVAMN